MSVLTDILIVDSSRHIGLMAAEEILVAPHLMDEALELAITAKAPMNWRAARAVEIAVEAQPSFLDHIEPRVLSVLTTLPEQGLRGFLKIYKKPKQILSTAAIDCLLQLCFDILEKDGYSTAVRAYAAQILEKIAKKEPDIIPEYIQVLEFQIERDETAFARSAKNIVKSLQKVQKRR